MLDIARNISMAQEFFSCVISALCFSRRIEIEAFLGLDKEGCIKIPDSPTDRCKRVKMADTDIEAVVISTQRYVEC